MLSRCKNPGESEANFIMSRNNKKELPAQQREELIALLKNRFEKNQLRHKNISWKKVQAGLEADSDKLWSLHEMEKTGGEPDVVEGLGAPGEIVFCDCSAETPSGRRKLCYDRDDLEARKQHKPENSALDIAEAMNVELLTWEQYRELQKLGEFDTKTSSWLKTPSAIRRLGGALFGDRRYDHVFLYHNGAESYYAVRGFRAILTLSPK